MSAPFAGSMATSGSGWREFWSDGCSKQALRKIAARRWAVPRYSFRGDAQYIDRARWEIVQITRLTAKSVWGSRITIH